jgi:hypothetical protein
MGRTETPTVCPDEGGAPAAIVVEASMITAEHVMPARRADEVIAKNTLPETTQSIAHETKPHNATTAHFSINLSSSA